MTDYRCYLIGAASPDALAVGLLTRPAALFIVINMTVAVLFTHAGDTFGERERALLFAVIALTFLIIGAGR